MYIARNSDGSLRLFGEKPERNFYDNVPNKGWWDTVYNDYIELSKEEDCYPELRWEDEPIKVLPMAVTDENELKDWWMAAPSAQFVRAFVDPESAENFARNNFRDIGLKVWHCTHE